VNEINQIRLMFERKVGSKKVWCFPRADWETLVCDQGNVTVVPQLPGELDSVFDRTNLVITTASGIVNPDPGIDVVRYDPKDPPNERLNIDHYPVIEDLTGPHKYEVAYRDTLKGLGISDSPELRKSLEDYVFVVGPEKLDHHHVAQLPAHIRNACWKSYDGT
jgi:hypothetical protein